jgi:hypothetical protein
VVIVVVVKHGRAQLVERQQFHSAAPVEIKDAKVIGFVQVPTDDVEVSAVLLSEQFD